MEDVFSESTNSISPVHISLISIVIPCYNEEACIHDFYKTLVCECNKHKEFKFEFIFVNDGSHDNTQRYLEDILENDNRVIIIEFSRNFGKESAISAGLDASNGDVVIPIDADLQHPPSVIFDLVQCYLQGNVDVVIAQRRSRAEESKIYRLCTGLFYKIEDTVSECHMPHNAGDFRLISRKVVDALCSLPEKRRFMKGLYAWVGFKTACVEYDVAQRLAGTSKFSPKSLITLACNGLLDFSSVPLRIWCGIGVLLSFLALCFGLWIIISVILFGIDVPGYASIIVSVFFFGGIHLISIGILGEYIGRIYNEVKSRPSYIIRKIIRHDKGNI